MASKGSKQKKGKGGGGGKGGRCPFASSEGYATTSGREDWVKAQGGKAKDIPVSLEANTDPDKPLYYWQIYSLTGPKPLKDIVTRFYHKVYADEEDPNFRLAFTQISEVEHHIETQTSFWIDSFGGGRAYHGGDYRLNFHHEHNAGQVMNQEGAARWMYHMGNTLCEVDLSKIDVRIKPCIIEFLRVKVKKYAKQHNWKYNEADFDFVKRDKEMITLYEKEITTLSVNDLPKLNSKELKKFLEFAQVDTSECLEKQDFIKLAEEALLIKIQRELDALEMMGNKELIKLLWRYNLDSSNCIEKSDMLELARETIKAKAGHLSLDQPTPPTAAAAAEMDQSQGDRVRS